jgi:hypothetical protein
MQIQSTKSEERRAKEILPFFALRSSYFVFFASLPDLSRIAEFFVARAMGFQ